MGKSITTNFKKGTRVKLIWEDTINYGTIKKVFSKGKSLLIELPVDDGEIETYEYEFGHDGRWYEINNSSEGINIMVVKKTAINRKYTHFAIHKVNNKVVNAWETITDIPTLKYYAKLDLIDMDLKPGDYKILSKAHLLRMGINPFDSNNWVK
jgi:hypothetical protein